MPSSPLSSTWTTPPAQRSTKAAGPCWLSAHMRSRASRCRQLTDSHARGAPCRPMTATDAFRQRPSVPKSAEKPSLLRPSASWPRGQRLSGVRSDNSCNASTHDFSWTKVSWTRIVMYPLVHLALVSLVCNRAPCRVASARPYDALGAMAREQGPRAVIAMSIACFSVGRTSAGAWSSARCTKLSLGTFAKGKGGREGKERRSSSRSSPRDATTSLS
mmetsp:Transcript_56714/g.151904  ORF Transcript_56714/g.151904 Transcript_56714/m.151904 type:complete len:217 (-) Transcript_56714:137-787(-)